MDDARPSFAADAAQVVDVVQQCVDESAARVPGRGMDDHSCRLVDDDDIGILIQDGQRQRFSLRCRFDRFRDVDGDRMACFHRLIRLCPGIAGRI